MRRAGGAPSGSGLLTTVEVARLLRVHPKHVYRLLRAGLPGLRVGGDWRFEPERVLAWARARAGRREGGDAPPAAILAANDDEAVSILLGAIVGAGGPLVGCVRADSGTALDLVGSGRATVAGFHRAEVPSSAGGRRLARLRFVSREVGLVGPRGRGAPPLAAFSDRRAASRPASAGTRSTLDRALAGAGLEPERVHRRAACLPSHRDVVCAVARGDADVGVTSRDWAERLGLPFRALAVEEYDLLIPAERLGDPAVVRLCEAAASRAVRKAVGSLPGHSARDAGSIRIEGGDSAPGTRPGTAHSRAGGRG
jgi:excisionase family DNA binding protein